jgi:hypothetical protein
MTLEPGQIKSQATLNIPALIRQLTEKNVLSASYYNKWKDQGKPAIYLFVNGFPIDVTINITIGYQTVHIDSVQVGYYDAKIAKLTTPPFSQGFIKYQIKTFSRKYLIDNGIVTEK